MFFHGRDSVQIYCTHKTPHLPFACSLTFSRGPLLLCQLLTRFTLQDARRNGECNEWYEKNANWHLTTFSSQADKSARLHFHRQPPHAQRNSRVKKGEIGQRLGFQGWPVNGCLHKPVALSHDISRATRLLLSKSLQPHNPQSFFLLVNPHKRHRAKKLEEMREDNGKSGWGEKKHRKGKRGEKWDRETRRVEGLLLEELL